jgi:hypothetical protein
MAAWGRRRLDGVARKLSASTPAPAKRVPVAPGQVDAADPPTVVPTAADAPAVDVDARAPDVDTAKVDGGPAKTEADASSKPPEPTGRTEGVKLRPDLEEELRTRGLDGELTFAIMDAQTQSKVKTALSSDPFKKEKTAVKRPVAEQWALGRAAGDPREFANRYEFVKARYNQLRADLKGQPNIDVKALDEITSEKLDEAFEGHAGKVRSGPEGEHLATMLNNPDEIAAAVQKLDHVAFESVSSEVYHAVKHRLEVPQQFMTGDAVRDYRAAIRDTVRTGEITSAGSTDDGKTRVVIRKPYQGEGREELLEAIIYVEPDGTVTIASYGRAKAKP